MIDLLRTPMIHGGPVKSSVDSTQRKWELGFTLSRMKREDNKKLMLPSEGMMVPRRRNRRMRNSTV
ncbi:hypothetical protein C5167_031667 [Papaver somniferum]|uniref:Uncharacterized protein n=1 Tax=Papaver somniferum TaxID=3469 RepID=A0A4Y7K857_PAPSO|nr:hypothetical protein C5167_031667 [Papaver somniferum]